MRLRSTSAGWSSAGACIVAMAVASPAAAADVGSVLDRMRAALQPAADMRAALSVRIVNERGEEVRWHGTYSRTNGPPPRMRLAFDQPADIRGVELVVEQRPEDLDRFAITLPSIRRTRTIVQNLRGESFMGTDFNYEDLGFARLDYEKHSLEGEERLGERPCWKVVSVPRGSWWYGRIVRWIDTETALPVRTDYFDAGGVLYKRRTLDRIERIASHPTAHVMRMETLPAGTTTVLEFSNVAYGSGGVLPPRE